MGESNGYREPAILIAEDDEGHAELIRKNLARHGFSGEARCFRDGQQVLDFILAGGGDTPEPGRGRVLLLDIRMPKIDGIEVLRRIKDSEGASHLPVIMVTTTEDPREVEKCFEYGCAGYITKPVDYERLAELIRKAGTPHADAEGAGAV